MPRGFGLDAFFAQVLYGPFLIVILPVLTFFLLRSIFYKRKKRVEATDPDEILNFSFAWLIPVLAIRTLEWSTVPDPVNLVLVPVLCVALLLSLSICIRALEGISILIIIAAVLGLLIFSFSASVAPWGFITHRFWIGIAATAVSLVGALALELPLMFRIHGAHKRRKAEKNTISEMSETLPQA